MNDLWQLHIDILSTGLRLNSTEEIKHTVMMPSRRPESGLFGSCLSIDHFSTMDETWGLSTLRIRKPVMLTPQKRYGSKSMAIRSFGETPVVKDGFSFSLCSSEHLFVLILHAFSSHEKRMTQRSD